jgi:hypothetical protein
MKPFQIILIILVTIVAIIAVYNILYNWKTGTIVIPKKIPTKTKHTCNVSALGTSITDYQGHPVSNTDSVDCADCQGYMAVQASGSCKMMDYDGGKNVCETVGDNIPCPWTGRD